MKFTEFYNRQRNVIKQSIARRIETNIAITEERDAFYKGELFQKYDIVESEGKQYTILEQCSNYYQVVDSAGNVSRKFPKQLTAVSKAEIASITESFHGYKIQTPEATEFLQEAYTIGSLDNDDVGILKQLKKLDEQMDQSYKSRDKMTVAKIIADAVGLPHAGYSSPDQLVAAAIRAVKKKPNYIKQKEMIDNMLSIAREVGINVPGDMAESVDESKEGYSTYQGKGNHKPGWILRADPELKKKFDDAMARRKAKSKALGSPINPIKEDNLAEDTEQLDEFIFNNQAKIAAKAKAEFEKRKAARKKTTTKPHIWSSDSYDTTMKRGVREEKEPVTEKQLEELDISTVKSYKEKAAQSKPGTVQKAVKRFGGMEKAEDRIHKDELKKMQDRLSKNESTGLTLSELRKKLNEAAAVEVTDEHKDDEENAKTAHEPITDPAKDVKAHKDIDQNPDKPVAAVPHGHSFGPTSNTHRRQLINKLRDH